MPRIRPLAARTVCCGAGRPTTSPRHSQRGIVMRGRTILFAAAAMLVAATSVPCQGQIATLLFKDGDQLPGAPPGHNVSSIHGGAANHAGGYAFRVDTSDGIATLSRSWGNPTGGPGTVLWTEGTYGSYAQGSWESFYGFSDAGLTAYSPLSTNLDSGATSLDGVWVNDISIMNEQEVYPHAPGLWWSFGSRPGITADGIPYFVGGVRTTQTGTTSNRGLFYGYGALPLLLGGMTLENIPAPLSTANTIAFDYRFSPQGTHYIGKVETTESSALNNYIVIDGKGIFAGGSIVGEGRPVPGAIGGLPGENWQNFDYTGITESGSYMFTGDTSASTAIDEFICKDGVILYREGMDIGGAVVTGGITMAYMNADGDIAYVWPVVTATGTAKTLFVNDQPLLKVGQEVDIDGDLVPDAGAVITDITGIASLALGDRGGDAYTRVYFTANVDIPSGAAFVREPQAPPASLAAREQAGLSDGDLAELEDPQRVVVEGAFVLIVPTAVSNYLAVFHLAPNANGVIITWRVGDEAGAPVFRLLASQGDASWEVPYQQVGAGSFQAADGRAEPGASVTYALYLQTAGGDWTLLSSQTAEVPVPALLTRVVGAHPNPFNPQTRIVFTVARSQDVRLVVRDLSGRLVVTLAEGAFAAGEHAVDWNGLDQTGRPVASGAYLAQLEADGKLDAKKIMLVR